MNQPKSALHSIQSWHGWRVVGWSALVLVVITLIGALAYGVIYVIQTQGTGFFDHTDARGKFIPGKTLWDWISLLCVPVMLTLATAGFGYIQERNRRLYEVSRERVQQQARDQEAALQAYFNNMAQLIREENLGAAPPEDEGPTAKARRE